MLSLLSLPLELRLIIYRFLFHTNPVTLHPASVLSANPQPSIALLLTCHQVYHEAHPLLESEAFFQIFLRPDLVLSKISSKRYNRTLSNRMMNLRIYLEQWPDGVERFPGSQMSRYLSFLMWKLGHRQDKLREFSLVIDGSMPWVTVSHATVPLIDMEHLTRLMTTSWIRHEVKFPCDQYANTYILAQDKLEQIREIEFQRLRAYTRSVDAREPNSPP